MSDVLPLDVLDEQRVASLRVFGRVPGELLLEMVHDFLLEAPSLVAEIQHAVEEGEHEKTARAAHRLKGTCGHMGARRLAAVASEIDSAARAGSRDAMVVAASTVREELELALAATLGLLDGR